MGGTNGLNWEKLIEEGYSQYLGGHFFDAELIYKAALAVAVRARNTVHGGLGRIFFLLAELYFERKDYGQSESFYSRALFVYQNLKGFEVDCCVVLKKLSEVFRIQGKAEQAFEMADRSEELLQPTINLLEAALLKSTSLSSNSYMHRFFN